MRKMSGPSMLMMKATLTGITITLEIVNMKIHIYNLMTPFVVRDCKILRFVFIEVVFIV